MSAINTMDLAPMRELTIDEIDVVSGGSNFGDVAGYLAGAAFFAAGVSLAVAFAPGVAGTAAAIGLIEAAGFAADIGFGATGIAIIDKLAS